MYDLEIVKIKTYNGYESFYFYSYGLIASFLPAIAVYLVGRDINLKKITNSYYLFSLIPALLLLFYLIQTKGLSLNLLQTRFGVESANSIQDNTFILSAITISYMGTTLASISLLYLLIYYKGKNILTTILNFLSFLLGIFLLIIGASRGPLLAFLIISIFIFMFFYKVSVKTSIFYSKLALIVIILLSTVAFLQKQEDFSEINRLSISEKIVIGNERIAEGEDGRLYLWSGAISQFLESPIIGDSFLEKKSSQYPHNIFLEVLMATGIIGSFFFYLMFIRICITVYRQFRFESTYMILLFGMLIEAMVAFTSGSLFDRPAFWVMCAIVIGVFQNTRNNTKSISHLSG